MNKKWFAFYALVPVAALIFLDQTILPVALPTIQVEFNASNTALQWCVNAYLLAIAVFVLISGKIGDRISHRNALFLGMSAFALFSAICGMSPNIETLIIARGFQGIGAALMLPAQTALIGCIFPQQKRGQAIGMIVSLGSLFLMLGPLVGGYLTEAISWRWIFWINLPISAFALWMNRKFLPTSEPHHKKIDRLGFLFFCLRRRNTRHLFYAGRRLGLEFAKIPHLLRSYSNLFWTPPMERKKRAPTHFLILPFLNAPSMSQSTSASP